MLKPAVTGQTVEWLVWTAITVKSHGALHPYLPLRDLGVDAMIRHRASDVSLPVQVKGRTELDAGNTLRIHVQTEEAVVPGAMLIAVVVDLDAMRVREPLFVVGCEKLAELAPLVPYGPRRAYAFEVPYPPHSRSRWGRYACSLDELPGRLVPLLERPETAIAEDGAAKERAEATGYLGEMMLLRHIGSATKLSVFRAAPDTEFVEYLILRTDTGRYAGLQVKCTEPAAGRNSVVHVRTQTIDESVQSFLLIFVRTADRGSDATFSDSCFLIPSRDLPRISVRRDERLNITIAADDPRVLAKYRVPLNDLEGRLFLMLAG